MAKELDTAVEAFRSRPLDAGPYTFVAADALVLKVREAGRVVNVHALIAVGVNAEGYREILGVDVTTAEDGAGWLTFLRSLAARGLSGVKLVTSDAHAGLLAAIGATLPGATWQRCRTHYATNLMAITPKSSWPWVRVLLHSVYDQPEPHPLLLNMFGSSTRYPTNSLRLPTIWRTLELTYWHSLLSPNRFGARSGRTTPKSGSTGRSAAALLSSASSPTVRR
jgi:putative transposase